MESPRVTESQTTWRDGPDASCSMAGQIIATAAHPAINAMGVSTTTAIRHAAGRPSIERPGSTPAHVASAAIGTHVKTSAAT